MRALPNQVSESDHGRRSRQPSRTAGLPSTTEERWPCRLPPWWL